MNIKSMLAHRGVIAIIALLAAAFSAHGVADSQVAANKPGHLEFTATKGGNTWKVYLKEEATPDGGDTCKFSVAFTGPEKQSSLTRKAIDDCGAVGNVNYSTLGADFLLIDAASERGGRVIVLHAASGKVYPLTVKYEGADEDSLKAKVKGETLTLTTTLDNIVISVLPDGKLNVSAHKTKR